MMRRYHSRYVATKENKWQGPNFPRWVNKDYDAAIDAAETEIDPVKRAALYIKCNDLMWQDTVVHSRDASPQGGRQLQRAAPAVMRGWANDPTICRTGIGRLTRGRLDGIIPSWASMSCVAC